MSYTSTPIFYKKPVPGVDMYRPTGPVDCRVVRAALFGSHEAGDLGVYRPPR